MKSMSSPKPDTARRRRGALPEASVPPEGDSDRSGVQSVENGLQLLLALANSRRPMKITDLAASVGVTASFQSR